MSTNTLLLLVLLPLQISSFFPSLPPSAASSPASSPAFFSALHPPTHLRIVSPFDSTAETAEAPSPIDIDAGPLDLTMENVEAVLDTMRPYLQADGGNVLVSSIDGPVVYLELVGECGTCPSSTQTMKMGLEKKLLSKIPEIAEVIQSIPTGPDLTEEQVDVVLETVRPFLAVAGGTITCTAIVGTTSTQPTIKLTMLGASASLNSVKAEIQQRIQRHFVLPGLRVEWEGDKSNKPW